MKALLERLGVDTETVLNLDCGVDQDIVRLRNQIS